MPKDGAKWDSININITAVGIEIKKIQQLIFTAYLEELTMNDSIIKMTLWNIDETLTPIWNAK